MLCKNTLSKKKNSVFERNAGFFLAQTKAQRDEFGGRILLGYDTGEGAVMVRPIRFRCVGIWISTGLPYVYTRH
jgi:hypothetical protein